MLKLGQPVLHASEEMVDVGFLAVHVVLLFIAMPLLFVSSMLFIPVAPLLVSSVLLLLVALLVMLSPLFLVLAGTIGTPHLGSPGPFIATGACLFSGSRSLFSLEFGSSGVVPALSKRWKGKQAHQDKGEKCGIHYCLGHG